MNWLMKPNIRSCLLFLLLQLCVLGIFIKVSHNPASRVGDGSEYYGLFYAWEISHTPWMTESSLNAYELLHKSGEVPGLVPRKILENTFPLLKIGATHDFNHFWFYSLLATLASKLLLLLGAKTTVNQSFLVLHFFLITIVNLLAFRQHKWPGVFTVLFIVFFSPTLWFLDKVHTEFFTICLASSAILLAMENKVLEAALPLAVASTQNPSFALIASFLIFIRLAIQYKQLFRISEVACMLLACFFILLHPLYYLVRYAVPTPQLLAGGASLGSNLGTWYIWLLDPDLGLFPNWPLGALVIIVTLTLMAFHKKRYSFIHNKIIFAGFTLVYLITNFYAHSSTTNLNSGATPGIARYALWYLPLTIPIILWFFKFLSDKKKYLLFAVFVFTYLGSRSIKNANPGLPESYLKPSTVSAYIQTKIPWLYDPPIEVFMERFTGEGEAVHQIALRGIVGPDCRKLLLFPGGDKNKVITSPNCFFDSEQLLQQLNKLGINITEPQYIRLKSEEASNLSLILSTEPYRIGTNGTGNFILKSGWGVLEDWGVWSNENLVYLGLPCNSRQRFMNSGTIAVSLVMHAFIVQELQISVENQLLWQGTLTTSPQHISVKIPVQACQNDQLKISLEIKSITSPFELGLSDDTRKLGLALTEFQVSAH